jgi:tetratricopeptide (TPR) repeat protein
MKIIKHTFIILLIATGSNVLAQTQDVIQAFSKSYDYEKKADYTNAITAIKGVYDKSSYEINLRLGWLSYEAAQYKESASYYQIAEDIMPLSIEAKLGYAYPAAALGKTDDVIAIYQKILEGDPQNSTVNYKLGYMYYNKKDYQSALKYFEKVVNLYPFNYDGLLMYAWTNYQLGKTREAQVLFNKVLMLSPDDKLATQGLSLIK